MDVVDGNAVRSSFNPNAWHESGPETVVCRQREIRGDRVYAREIVLNKSSGLIRDRTYAIRLYTAETVRELIESSGFKAAAVCGEFSSHRLKADYGFMNRRIVATAQKL